MCVKTWTCCVVCKTEGYRVRVCYKFFSDPGFQLCRGLLVRDPTEGWHGVICADCTAEGHVYLTRAEQLNERIRKEAIMEAKKKAGNKITIDKPSNGRPETIEKGQVEMMKEKVDAAADKRNGYDWETTEPEANGLEENVDKQGGESNGQVWNATAQGANELEDKEIDAAADESPGWITVQRKRKGSKNGRQHSDEGSSGSTAGWGNNGQDRQSGGERWNGNIQGQKNGGDELGWDYQEDDDAEMGRW